MEIRRSVCALLLAQGRVCAVRRLPGGTQGGKWEFPGGKVEDSESLEEALTRELAEELLIQPRASRLFSETEFRNQGRRYRLFAFEVSAWQGEPALREHSELRWCTPLELAELDFSDSDRDIADLWRRASEGLKG